MLLKLADLLVFLGQFLHIGKQVEYLPSAREAAKVL